MSIYIEESDLIPMHAIAFDKTVGHAVPACKSTYLARTGTDRTYYADGNSWFSGLPRCNGCATLIIAGSLRCDMGETLHCTLVYPSDVSSLLSTLCKLPVSMLTENVIRLLIERYSGDYRTFVCSECRPIFKKLTGMAPWELG